MTIKNEEQSKARHVSPSPSPRRRPGSRGDDRPLMPLDTSLRWYDDQERTAEQGAAPIPLSSPRRRPGSSGDHRPLMPLDTSLRWYDDQEQRRRAEQGAAPIPITSPPAQAGVQWRPPTTVAT